MKVTLRQRLKGDKVTLYLDYYHEGKRNYEHFAIRLLYRNPKKESSQRSRKRRTEKTYHLQKPSAAKDIWGCRMVFMVSKTRVK